MCLNTYSSGSKKAAIFRAGYDILVFKALDYVTEYGIYNRPKRLYSSPYQNTPYVMGRMNRVSSFGFDRTFGGDVDVDQGLHAYSKLWRWFDKVNDRDQLFPAIIPKGTLFIPGTGEEVVALALVVHGWRWYDQRALQDVKRGNWKLHERVCSFAEYDNYPEKYKS